MVTLQIWAWAMVAATIKASASSDRFMVKDVQWLLVVAIRWSQVSVSFPELFSPNLEQCIGSSDAHAPTSGRLSTEPFDPLAARHIGLGIYRSCAILVPCQLLIP